MCVCAMFVLGLCVCVGVLELKTDKNSCFFDWFECPALHSEHCNAIQSQPSTSFTHFYFCHIQTTKLPYVSELSTHN